MTTHHVVLAFTPEHDGDINGIPWVDLLAGGVKVTNWQYVNEATSKKAGLILGMNDCISRHDCENDLKALLLIVNAAENDSDIPFEITVCEQYEGYDSPGLLDAIETASHNYIGKYVPLVKDDNSQFETLRELEKLQNCANALLTLYLEVKDCDGFNPNLEGPENDAEQSALKALQAAGLIGEDDV